MDKHGGYLVARTLAAEQIPVIFTLCGGHIASIYDGCIDFGIRMIDFRHEQAAAHAADAWARVTGQPGVVVVTAGPGVTGTVTAVANAMRAGSPMLVLGGQGGVGDLDRGALQEMDHVELMKSITKWSRRVHQTDRIPEYIATAFRHACSGRPGPVFLELPVDVLFGVEDVTKIIEPTGYRTHLRPFPNRALIEQAAELLSGAQRPVVMAGTATRWCDAGDALRRLVERLAAPCYLNGMGRGCLSASHPNFLQLSRKQALSKADVVVLAGVGMDFRMHYGAVINSGAKLIQLDLSDEELGHNRGVNVGIAGDVAVAFEQLLTELPSRTNSGNVGSNSWLEELRLCESAVRDRFAPAMQSADVPIHPLRFANAIKNCIDDDTIVVGDGGEIVALVASVLEIHEPVHWLDPGPLGCLGVGMPFAIAAQLAAPDKRVLIVYGDGAFGLNGMEYDTAVRFGLPIVGVVGNDLGWGQIRRPQIHMFGESRSKATSLGGNARYDKIVEAVGGWGVRVSEPFELESSISTALAQDRPALVDVLISDQPIDPARVVDLSKV